MWCWWPCIGAPRTKPNPDSDQLAYAQLLSDLGVDVVLGSHPHVIGPLAWVEGASGNRTLVAYSLGNFLSNHDAPAPLNELEGMLSCTFVKDANGVRVEDAAWTPFGQPLRGGRLGRVRARAITRPIWPRATHGSAAWTILSPGSTTPAARWSTAWAATSPWSARQHSARRPAAKGRRRSDHPTDGKGRSRDAKRADAFRNEAPRKRQSTIEKLPDLAVRRIAEERARQPSRTRAVC